MASVIITGASGNLGRALTTAFTEAGYQVAGTGVWADAPASYQGTRIDLTDEAATDEWITAVLASQGIPEAVIMTAGGFTMGTISSTPVTVLREQLRLNVDTAYNVVRPVLAAMKSKGEGCLFFIGSRAGMDPGKNADTVAYGLSKSLLFRLSELINQETAGTRIRSFVVVPGIIDSAPNREAMPDADFSTWQTPEAIARKIMAVTAAPEGVAAQIIF